VINRKVLIVLLFLLFTIFIGIPLVISINYGNIPFYDNDALETTDIIVSNNKNISGSELSFINNNTYTWEEIEHYIIRKEMSFLRILRNIVIIIGVAVGAVVLDRIFLRH